MKKPSEKASAAYKLRLSGASFTEISAILGCHRGHAAWLFERGKRWEEEKVNRWDCGIRGIENILRCSNLYEKTEREIHDLIKSGLIKPGFTRLYGPKIHRQVCERLGISTADDPTNQKRKWKFNPLTGEKLK